MDHVLVPLLIVFFCPGLLPPPVLGQSSGRDAIHGLLARVCEEIPRAAHSVSGEDAVAGMSLLTRGSSKGCFTTARL